MAFSLLAAVLLAISLPAIDAAAVASATPSASQAANGPFGWAPPPPPPPPPVHKASTTTSKSSTTSVSWGASPYAGTPTSFVFPSSLIEYISSESAYFPPPSEVGYPGPTPTGAEPFLIENAVQIPKKTDFYPLVAPTPTGAAPQGYNILTRMGNLGPAYSADQYSVPGSSQLIPENCELIQLHKVSRHGSRYPTSGSAPAQFAVELQNLTKSGEGFTASGPLSFLNTWEYGLGAEILTPFGRQQLYDEGVKDSLLYGRLLERSPGLFARTTSEKRMVQSAENYLYGFFGEEKAELSELSIIIEATGFNNSLAGYDTCNNSNSDAIGYYGDSLIAEWQEIYLAGAVERLQPYIEGLTLTTSMLYSWQQLCSYETVAYATSPFCGLFTYAEWEGYEYAIDISFWYSSSYGQSTSGAIAVGYVQELRARLSNTPMPWSPAVNNTLDSNPLTFPFNRSIYADFTHDTIISTFVVLLNFTTLSAQGPLPATHIPPHRQFDTSYISPFGSQMAGQVMTCNTTVNGTTTEDTYIRWLLNDAVMDQSGMGNCSYDPNGLCRLDTYIEALDVAIENTDFDYACFGTYNMTANITNGQPPPRG